MSASDSHVHFHFESISNFNTINPTAYKEAAAPKPVPKKKTVFVGINNRSYSALNSIRYSTDSNNWINIKTGGFDMGPKDIAYGSTIWVAVGESSDPNKLVQYSKNGSNWSNANNTIFSSEFIPCGITYGSNLWVAIGSQTGGGNPTSMNSTIQYSKNASNWSCINDNSFDGFKPLAVAYGSNQWVALGTSAALIAIPVFSNGSNTGSNSYILDPVTTIVYTNDGSNWSNADTGGFDGLDGNYGLYGGIAYSSNTNKWVAVGVSKTSEGSIQYSMDGTNWSDANTGGFSVLESMSDIAIGNKVIYQNNLWLASGFGNTLAESFKYSRDGSNWSNAGNGMVGILTGDIAYFNKTWVAQGTPTNYSSNGSNWYVKPDNDISFVTRN